MSVTLKDFEVRYRNIQEAHPKIRKCSVVGCSNPRDTTMMGEDTSCAYHRLLFDAWMYGLVGDKIAYYFHNQRARRSAFTKWRNKLGEKACDKIVLRLAQEPINWKC
ncbi:hypothetical protein LCGC14_3004910 [marine sediment metagenome]|uniref:Uncharacterized protein n=1 Tax=marine sediment metagenome TaxID=412755 RepID=A0A0F8XMM4_9ZZZZ